MSVEVAASSVPSTEWLTVALSVTEAVSGVEGSVGGRLAGEDSAESDFIRTRRACSNTSWVMIPWVWARSRVYTSCQVCRNGWLHKGTNRDEDVAGARFEVSSTIQH